MAKKPAAPVKKDLTNEIATIGRDITMPVYGGVLTHQDDTLMTRGQGRGLKIYDDLERDCHAYAVLQKRKMAVVAREWTVDPASQSAIDVKAADMVERHLKAMGFDRVCIDLQDAVLKGFAVGEIMWRVDGNEIVPAEVRARNQRRFAFDREGKLRLLTYDAMVEGIELPERKFVVHRFGAKDGNHYGLGLGTRLFWPVYFKRQGITFWLTFADKFGNPTSVGKYPAGTDEANQKILLNALQALSHDTGVIIPESMTIDLLEAQRAGNVNSHEALCRYMDEQISEATLGETLTTNIGGSGSYAASNTHNDVREELTKADADLLSDTINNSLVKWDVELNMPGASPPMVWRDFEEPEDLTKRADRDKTVHDMGFKPTIEHIHEHYGEGWVERPTIANTPGAGDGWNELPKPPAEFAEPAGGTDPVAGLVAQTDAAAMPAIDTMIERVRALLDESADLMEFRDRLLEIYADVPEDKLADVLRQAFAVADLTGRAEIPDGR